MHFCILLHIYIVTMFTLMFISVLPYCDGEVEILCHSIPACLSSSEICHAGFNCGDSSALHCGDIESESSLLIVKGTVVCLPVCMSVLCLFYCLVLLSPTRLLKCFTKKEQSILLLKIVTLQS